MYEDQVPRLRRYRERHPDIEIRLEGNALAAVWLAERDGERIALAYHLETMLDYLEGLEAHDSRVG